MTKCLFFEWFIRVIYGLIKFVIGFNILFLKLIIFGGIFLNVLIVLFKLKYFLFNKGLYNFVLEKLKGFVMKIKLWIGMCGWSVV